MKTAWINPKNLAITIGIILAFIGGRFSNAPESDTENTAQVNREQSNKPRSASRSKPRRLPRISSAGAGVEAIITAEQVTDLFNRHGNRANAILQTTLEKMNSEELAKLAADLKIAPRVPHGSGISAHSILIPRIFIRWAEIDPEAALLFAKSENSPYHQSALQGVITTIAKSDAVYALREARKINNHLFGRQIESQVLSVMAINDPDAWISEILSNRKTMVQSNHIGSYVNAWFNKDQAAAIARIKRLPPQLIRNSIAQIGSAWAGKDPAAALQWAQDLENEQMKQQAIASVAGVIAKNNPDRAITLIANLPEGARQRALASIYKTMAGTDPMGTFEQALALSHSGDRHAALKSILNPYGYPFGSRHWGSYYYNHYTSNQTPQFTLEQLQSMVNRLPQGQLRDSVYGQMSHHLANFTPAQTEQFLRSYPERARQKMVSALIQKFTHTDPEHALALHQLFPESHKHNSNHYSNLLGAIAKTNPEKALQLALEDKVHSQRSSHINYITSQLSNHDPTEFARLVTTIDDKKLREQAISRLAGQWGNTDSDTAILWAKSLPGDDQHKALTAIIPSIANNDPQRAVTLYETLAANTGTDTGKQSSLTGVASNIASYWSTYDPEAASAWVSTLENENAQRNATSTLARNWAQKDFNKASEWVSTLPDGKTRDSGVISLVDHLTQYDPAAAFDWASSISEDGQRRYKLGNIIRQWKQHDLQSARKAIERANLADEEYEYLSKQLEP